MKSLGYYNGVYGLIEDIFVPMCDRACYFGDAIYDATYAHNHIPFALDEHIERFFNSAKLVDINMPLPPQELNALIRKLTQKVESGDTFIYFQVSRGSQVRDHVYDKNIVGNLWIMIKEAKIKDLSQKVAAITLEDNRYYYCNIKTTNLLPNVLYANIAHKANCYECILHRNNKITECAHSNVGILKNKKFVTPPLDCLILPGVARANIIKMCKKLNIVVEERIMLKDELFSADEIIICSAGSLCLGVSHIDNVAVGNKDAELLKMLQNSLLEEFWEATKEPMQQ